MLAAIGMAYVFYCIFGLLPINTFGVSNQFAIILSRTFIASAFSFIFCGFGSGLITGIRLFKSIKMETPSDRELILNHLLSTLLTSVGVMMVIIALFARLIIFP